MKSSILAGIGIMTLILISVVAVKCYPIVINQPIVMEQPQIAVKQLEKPIVVQPPIIESPIVRPPVQAPIKSEKPFIQQVPPIVPPVVPPKTEIKPEPIKKLPVSYQEALVYALSRNQKILLIFTTRPCDACDAIKTTLADPSVRTTLGNNGVCLLYYIDCKGFERTQAARYKVVPVPAYCIIDGHEKMYRTGAGYKDAITFKGWIDGTVD